jgi:hypothetical protein
MFHIFADIRISRKLTAHVVTNIKGETLGQFKWFHEAITCLYELGVEEFELHGPDVLYQLTLTGTAEVSEDAESLGKGFELAPWNVSDPNPGG